MQRVWELAVLMLFLSIDAGAFNTENDSAMNPQVQDTFDIPPPISVPGSRYVWEEGMDPVFNLTPMNCDLFYYDIDSNAGGEFLSIDLGNPVERVIGADHIIYQTSAFNTSFRYSPFGNYNAIGFLGEKYLVAYTEETKIAGRTGNFLIHRLLPKVLIDENENHTIMEGGNLTLGEGYILNMKDVNITEGSAVISIEKNGIDFYRKKLNFLLNRF